MQAIIPCDTLAGCPPSSSPPAPWRPARSPGPPSRRTPPGRHGPTRCAPSRCRCSRPAAQPLRVLHLSDIHMTPSQRRKQEWVRGAGGPRAGPRRQHRRQPRPPRRRPRRDRVARSPAGPARGLRASAPTTTTCRRCATRLRYLLPDTGRRNTDTPQLPWPRPAASLREAGWLDLTNRRDALEVGGTSFAFAGVDDPHLRYDRLDLVAGPADAARRRPARRRRTRRTCGCSTSSPPTATTRSSPATPTAVRSACPFVGALTTNCDLDTARAKGLHRHPADSRDGDPGSAWLHVSAGRRHQPRTPGSGSPAGPRRPSLTLTARRRLTSDSRRPLTAPVWLPRLRPTGARPRWSASGCGAVW